MESRAGRDIERVVFVAGAMWLLGATFRRKLDRWVEPIWWAIAAAFIAFTALAEFAKPLWPDDGTLDCATNDAGAWICPPARAGNMNLIELIMIVAAVAAAALSLATWEKAQVRRTRREFERYNRDIRNQQARAAQQAEWQRKAGY